MAPTRRTILVCMYLLKKLGPYLPYLMGLPLGPNPITSSSVSLGTFPLPSGLWLAHSQLHRPERWLHLQFLLEFQIQPSTLTWLYAEFPQKRMVRATQALPPLYTLRPATRQPQLYDNVFSSYLFSQRVTLELIK